ncbi:unnamed protein product, partial [Prunus brigantina]
MHDDVFSMQPWPDACSLEDINPYLASFWIQANGNPLGQMNAKNGTIITKKIRSAISSSLIHPIPFNVGSGYQAIRVLGLGSHSGTKTSVTFVSNVITFCVQWLKAYAITLWHGWEPMLFVVPLLFLLRILRNSLD